MGVPLQMAAPRQDHNNTYSVTLVCTTRATTLSVCLQVTDLTRSSGWFASDPRVESNTAEDFCSFLVHLIMVGVLRPGDVLIADNASVHTSEDIIDLVSRVLRVANVNRVLFGC